MGSFLVSTHIYNSKKLDRDAFLDFFCKEMEKEGYSSCKIDESEISYILRFSDNDKWVALTSEDYEVGNQFSQTDTGRIAKMLQTCCIYAAVIDSDFAMLDLYDESGKKKDSLVMGRADDYFGDDIPGPQEQLWSPFLESGHSWGELLEVQNGDYIFVEDGLSEFAPMIGMESEEILFSADSDDDDKRTEILHFKKTSAK